MDRKVLLVLIKSANSITKDVPEINQAMDDAL
jgi:hypothetical protein